MGLACSPSGHFMSGMCSVVPAVVVLCLPVYTTAD